MKASILCIVVISLSILSGCAAFQGGPNMDVAQLKAIASDKSATAVCSTISGPWGTGKVVVVNLDQRVISDGTVVLTPDCQVTMTNAIHDKPVTPKEPAKTTP